MTRPRRCDWTRSTSTSSPTDLGQDAFEAFFFVFAGVRYGFAMAWKVEALTEVFGASNGVGFMIRRAYQEFRVDDMLAWTALFIVTMVLIERGLAHLETRFFAWRKEIA